MDYCNVLKYFSEQKKRGREYLIRNKIRDGMQSAVFISRCAYLFIIIAEYCLGMFKRRMLTNMSFK